MDGGGRVHDTIEADVLVVGGGGAGCRAAIEAHDQGANVLMMVKGELGNSGCTLNVGTSAAVGPWSVQGDSDDVSMRDLLAYGGFLGNQHLARILVEESLDRVLELEEWGIDFDRDKDGGIAVNRSAMHTHPRNFAFKPTSASRHDYGSPPGIAMMDVLVGQVQERDIRVLDEMALVDLLTVDGRVVGATALDCRRSAVAVLKATATILATGTYSQVFAPTTVSLDETGDGQAAAFRAGAELIDMESTQFVATSTGHPQGSTFLNAKGEPFLETYGTSSSADVPKEALVYAVWKEIREGRGTEGENIFVDMTAPLRDERVASASLPYLRRRMREYSGAQGELPDPRVTPIETGPAAHTTIGGIRTNDRCETSVPGLYAAGAVAGGVYGLARPEGYTSMITLVFGRRAGLFAARGLGEADRPSLDRGRVEQSLERATKLVERAGGVQPGEVKSQIRHVMRRCAWVIKDEEGLRAGLQEIREIGEVQRLRAARSTSQAGPTDGYEWASALEVPNMLLTAELLLLGSIERRESRGAFFRDDYPDRDDSGWLRNIVYRQVDGEIVLDTAPVELKYCGPGH